MKRDSGVTLKSIFSAMEKLWDAQHSDEQEKWVSSEAWATAQLAQMAAWKMQNEALEFKTMADKIFEEAKIENPRQA